LLRQIKLAKIRTELVGIKYKTPLLAEPENFVDFDECFSV